MTINFFKNTVFLIVLTVFSCGSSMEKVAPQPKEIIVGAERFAEYEHLLQNKAVAIVGNQTSFLQAEDLHLVDFLLSKNINVTKVFSPEHGFRGTADAGEHIKDGVDSKTGIPLISLYGNNKKPTREQLKDLDIVIFDIQDVGARFYTYISTLHYVMEACAEAGIPVMVLDRPNPNGHYVDGPVLKEKHSSFIGMHPVPVVHGMTIGEYAGMINGEKWLKGKISCELIVIEMENYDHSMKYSLPIKPSPNLPNDKSINLYPTTCFFEGTYLNEGRGTHMQFQVFGAPDLPKDKYPFSYTPTSNEGAKSPKFKDRLCYGKDLRDTEEMDRLNLQWLIDAYHASGKKREFFRSSFTLLAGSDELQKQIENGLSAEEIRKTWEEGLNKYKEVRKKYLLYP